MKSKEANSIIDQIEALWNDFAKTRAFFPYINKSAVGRKSFVPPEFYRVLGLNDEVILSKPLSEQNIDQINDIGNWLNQCILIRLAALLQYERIINGKSSVNKGLEGSKEICILIKLRNKFAHSRGIYNPRKKENRELMNKIIECFDLEEKKYFNYPIPIDKVIQPIFEKSKIYVKQFFKNNLLLTNKD
jgi:hypothetical protein